jgi:hypothetical protein
MNDEQNFSTIASSYQPHDYRKARFAANMGDADLPLPTTDFLTADQQKQPKDLLPQ